MATVAISNDKLIVGVSGTVLLAVLGYSVLKYKEAKILTIKRKEYFGG
ncbi:MAG: hypothetical protein IPI65_15655 [Bacteroidetes bacterium]|nr:hypothetical protein [Bacteroidota bacterium]